jgi:hypothetical protein
MATAAYDGSAQLDMMVFNRLTASPSAARSPIKPGISMLRARAAYILGLTLGLTTGCGHDASSW